MAHVIDFQLDLFETPEERALRLLLEVIDSKHDKTKQSLDRVRKGTYANIGELRKQVMDLSQRLEYIERAICHSSQHSD